jgi:hypothetical protein
MWDGCKPRPRLGEALSNLLDPPGKPGNPGPDPDSAGTRRAAPRAGNAGPGRAVAGSITSVRTRGSKFNGASAAADSLREEDIVVDMEKAVQIQLSNIQMKTCLGLRRTKQFAMVGPATKSQVEIGLNAKQLEGGARLAARKPDGMCRYGSIGEVDDELVGWIRAAYEAAG